MAEVTVIVPVYNTEAYINRCIDSILCQSHEDFSLILVDDGSPDHCGAICDSYAVRDKRVHVIHQKNGGLSAARNAGLDWALANTDCQWLTFVDSDDWIHPQMLEQMLEAALSNHVNISVCSFARTNGEIPWTKESGAQAELWSPKDYYQQRFTNATIACAKLYHRSSFASIRYPVGKIHEDEFVTYQLLFSQKNLACISEPLYAYFINPVGITKKAWSPKRLDAWDAYEEQLAYFKGLGDGELVRFRYRGYLENAMVNWKAASESLPKDAPVLRQMKKRIRSLLRRAWKDGCLDYWIDHEILSTFRPLWTRGYCFYWETLQNIRRRFPWLQ